MVQIEAEDELYRRILHYHVVKEEDGYRISSAAFMTKSRKPDQHCSVYLARLTTPEQVLLGGVPNQQLAGLFAEKPLSMGLTVESDNRPEDPAHCVILGLKSKQQCEELASGAHLVDLVNKVAAEDVN